MNLDYSALGAQADTILKQYGCKITITQQPEGTTSNAYGIFTETDQGNYYAPGTTTLYKTYEVIMSPKLKVVPKPGDWLTRGSSDDRFVVKAINACSPAGINVVYDLLVEI